MSSPEELSEPKIFHILRIGESESSGPFSQEELEELLSFQKVTPSDLVFYSGLSDWQPLSEVFDLRKGAENYLEDGQDREIASVSYATISESSVPDEDILYIAVQDLTPEDRLSEILQLMPKSVVLTDRRICIVTPRLIGDVEVKSFPLDQIERIAALPNRKAGGDDLNIVSRSGKSAAISSIPEAQRDRLVELAEKHLQGRSL